MEIKKILKYAYEVESRGQKFYCENSLVMKNQGAKMIFEKLAEMENEHKKYLIDFAIKKGIEIEEIEEGNVEHFEKRYAEVTPKSSMSSDLGDLAALRLAYLIEHDLADFYKKASSKTEDEDARKLLLELAYWEDEHERMIKEEYNEILERSWGDAGFFPF